MKGGYSISHLSHGEIVLVTSDDDILGFLVDSEFVLSTRYGKVRVFINKTSSTETTRKLFFIVID